METTSSPRSTAAATRMLTVFYMCASALLMALSVPLMVKLIGPNGLYGFRVEKTLADPDIWYAVNRVLGIDMLAAGTLLFAVCLYMFRQHKKMSVLAVSMTGLIATVVLLGAAIAHASFYLSSL